MLPEIASPRTLMAGDVIQSINGMPVYAFGDSIATILEYLKHCNQIFIVAYRSNDQDANVQRIVETVSSVC